MTTVEKMLEASKDIWRSYNEHPFVLGIQNGTLDRFSSNFIRKVIDNPIYCGRLAYGRRKTEKISGTRNEYHIVQQEEFPVYEGAHEGIVSVEEWEAAQVEVKYKYYIEKQDKHLRINQNRLSCYCYYISYFKLRTISSVVLISILRPAKYRCPPVTGDCILTSSADT